MNARERSLAHADAILQNAKDEGRGLSDNERVEVQRAIDEAKLSKRIDAMSGRMASEPMVEGYGGGGLLSAVMAAGFDRVAQPTVRLPYLAALTPPSPATDSSVTRLAGITETGEDRRYLYQYLNTVGIGDALRIDALVETSRTLPSPLSSAVLDPTGSATKPEVDSTVALETFDTVMIAVTSGMVPNAIFGLRDFSKLVNDILGHGFRSALDDYVATTIYDAGIDSGSDGADLLEQIRNGQAALQANGFRPDLVALSPSDSVEVDLYRGGVEKQFILQPAPRSAAFSPLWGMQVVTCASVTDPLIITTSAITLHAGNSSFSVDPYSGFTENTSQARLEAAAALVVSQPQAVYQISSS